MIDFSELERPDRSFTPVLAVDFDGTLFTNAWPEIGSPNTDLIDSLKDLRRRGVAHIILWTCRSGERLKAAVEACREVGLEFDAVNDNLPHITEAFGGDSRKIFANYYIDDKAMRIVAKEAAHA